VLLTAVTATGAPAQSALFWPDDPPQQEQRRPDDAVKQEIQAKLAGEPELKGLSISVKVDGKRVVLGGRLHSTAQKNKALEIAKTSAEGRQVVDDFEIIP
jgi:osmotically-inducible protein OsmY